MYVTVFTSLPATNFTTGCYDLKNRAGKFNFPFPPSREADTPSSSYTLNVGIYAILCLYGCHTRKLGTCPVTVIYAPTAARIRLKWAIFRCFHLFSDIRMTHNKLFRHFWVSLLANYPYYYQTFITIQGCNLRGVPAHLRSSLAFNPSKFNSSQTGQTFAKILYGVY